MVDILVLENVFEFGEGWSGPTIKKGQVLEKVHKHILVFDLYFFEDSIINVFAYHSEMTVGKTLNGCCSWFIVHEGKLPKGFSQR